MAVKAAEPVAATDNSLGCPRIAVTAATAPPAEATAWARNTPSSAIVRSAVHPERATTGSSGRAPIAEIAAAIEGVIPELSRMPRVLMDSGALMDDPIAWVSASTHCSPRALGARRLSGARPHAPRYYRAAASRPRGTAIDRDTVEAGARLSPYLATSLLPSSSFRFLSQRVLLRTCGRHRAGRFETSRPSTRRTLVPQTCIV